eukprot:403371218
METRGNITDLNSNLPVQYLSDESNEDEGSENEDYIETPKNVVLAEKPEEKKVSQQDIRKAIHAVKAAKMSLAVNNVKKKFDDVYLRGDKIGQGSFGKVYKVVTINTHQQRVVKVIPKGSFAESIHLNNEISALIKLNHPNLVKLIETFEDTRKIYLVQEYLSGETLFQRLVKRTQLDEAYSRTIFRQIMESINYIHQHNISHRDIKPENFVFASTESDVIKMIDFGLASHIQTLSVSQKNFINRMKSTVGTAWYIAPEVLQQAYTEKCDIWSAGVMLYVLLSGFPPFYNENDTLIPQEIMQCNYDFLDDEWEGISDEAKDLIKKMLTLESRRPTAKEVLDHPWFTMNSDLLQNQDSQNHFSSNALLRLIEYSSATKIRQIIYYFIAYRCNINSELVKYQEIFTKIDKDKNGYIDKAHMIKVLSKKIVDEERLDMIVNSMDIDNNGKIYWNEFLHTLISREIVFKHENLREAYECFDQNQKGYFDAEDFQRAVSNIGNIQVVKEEIPKLLFDAFQKQKITYEDLGAVIYSC